MKKTHLQAKTEQREKGNLILQESIHIAGKKIDPGKTVFVNVPVAKLYTSTAMAMPVHIIHGKQPGPRIFICGAVHGDEIIGTEIIRRLLKLKKVNNLKGTLIAVPVVNVYAFERHSRYSPDRRDLNRCFPGLKTGSLTSQLAATFMSRIIKGCKYGFDLHAGSNHRANLPQIRADIEDPDILELAKAFRVPVVINSAVREGSLRQSALDQGIKALIYEAGESLRFDEEAIRAGVRGLLSVMTHIGMIGPPSVRRKSKGDPLIAESTSWIRAPASGILEMKYPLGATVSKNSKIGVIADPFGRNEKEIISPVSGMVIGRLNLPLVHKGDAVIHIAHVDRLKKIAPAIEEFKGSITKYF